MTDAPTYPTITDALLVPFRAIEAQMGTFPDLLNRPDCPYPPHIRAFLARLAGTQVEAREAYTDDEQLEEITSLYEEIKRSGLNVNTTDPKDKMQILKAAADLLTKMTSLREKQINIRQMAHFQRSVLEVLESVLTPAQRSEFVEKLGKYAENVR
jgi:hypothetical protein